VVSHSFGLKMIQVNFPRLQVPAGPQKQCQKRSCFLSQSILSMSKM